MARFQTIIERLRPSGGHNRHLSRDQRGFTIVELLIVIVIIAVLATLTVVAYVGIQNNARATAAKSALNQVAKQMALYEVNHDSYPNRLADVNILDTESIFYQYTVDNTPPASYCVTATVGTVSYYINTTTAAQAEKGGCPGHGTGGVAAIVNMMINPGADTEATYAIGNNLIVSRDDEVWTSGGDGSFLLTPNSESNESSMAIGGDSGGFRLGMQAGKTYTVSAKVYVNSELTGILHANSLRIAAWYTTPGSSDISILSDQAPNSNGSTILNLTFSIPADATAAWIRFYHGGSVGSGTVNWDDIMLTEGSTQYDFADGFREEWVWSGTPTLSTSYGPAP